MQKLVYILFLLFLALPLSAQSGIIKVSNGKVVEGEFFLKNQYVLENFEDAKITLNDGTLYENKANISTVMQVLRILGKKGDTLDVNVEKMIKSVRVNSGLFYKINNLYIKILDTDGDVFLGQSKVIQIAEEAKKGAYGTSQETASVTNINTVSFNDKISQLTGEASLRFDYSEKLFLIKNGKLYVLTTKNLIRFFPKKASLIDEYIEKNHIDINKKNDAITLFKYILNN